MQAIVAMQSVGRAMTEIDKIDKDYIDLAKSYLSDGLNDFSVMKIMMEALPFANAVAVVRTAEKNRACWIASNTGLRERFSRPSGGY